MKRLIAATLAVGFALAGILTGCESNVPTSVDSDGVTELTAFWMDTNTVVDGNLPVLKRAEELTNVRIRNTLSKTTTDLKQAFGVMMASKKLSDIIAYYGREEITRYGVDGAIEPLNELIEQYAPNLKAFLDSRPDVRKYMTAPNGEIYFIPYIPDGDVAKAWFIRKDWLDKLNLPVPKSAEEFYSTLIAFRDDDPNGNGEKDEVPYFNRNVGAQWEEGISDLYSIWGAHKSWYADNGKVKYGALETEYKTAMANVSQWYADKLIDQEIYTRGNQAREILLGNNTGGVTHDWIGSNASFNDSLKDKIPGFEFVGFRPPSGVEITKRDISGNLWCMSSTNKDKVATMKYFDFWFTDEGRRLANFGLEGEQYDVVDGKPIFRDSILKADVAANIKLREIGAQLLFGYWQDFAYEEQWLTPVAKTTVSEYLENGYIGELWPVGIQRTEEEERRYSELITAIETHRDEYAQKWVLGNEKVENTFDKYLSEMRGMKIDELIEIQQAAYDRYMSN